MTNDIDTARYQKRIELGQLALKILVLINGGAAVALLAFIGGIWTSGIERCVAISLTVGIGAFALGVLSGAVAAYSAFSTAAFSQSDNHTLGAQSALHTHCANKLSILLFLIGISATVVAILIHFL